MIRHVAILLALLIVTLRYFAPNANTELQQSSRKTVSYDRD
ncbi:hypothetical protein OAB57_02625 [Bacteriovoracaceae bacterium]|nr:hypothetical protein [Bacteriovoracaceae bacterium]